MKPLFIGGAGISEYYNSSSSCNELNNTLYVVARKNLKFANFKVKRALYKAWVSMPLLKIYWFALRNKNQYDIIHIHSIYGVCYIMPFKHKVVEFHGDDIRKAPSMYWRIKPLRAKLFAKCFGFRNKVYVSTPDLLSEVPGSVWLPNIVDTEHFKPMPEIQRNPVGALYCSMWYEDGSHAKDFVTKHNLCLTVLERDKNAWVDHRKFPAYLNQFTYYIDRKEIHSLSKTALEALACGLKVVDWQGNVVTGLPSCHKPEVVAKQSIKIYEDVLKHE